MASQAVEEIKSKIDLADLVGEYVQLKKAGVNYKAPCPFHHEKTPSFLVSKEKQIWHCFGCGEGGDIFGFIMRIEGLDFPEALKLLAERAGVKLQEFHSEISASARNRILDILKMAAKFYHKILLDSSQAEEARQYLNKRQVAAEMLEEFQIGYIPDEWDILTNFLLKKGFGINDLVAAGLTIKKEGGGYYDRFRGRIMFPIADVHGNVVGFTGRLLNENKVEAGGKYVNTPQTIVFDKSRLLYALDRAKQVARKQNKLIIVEGQMDVVSCYQFGQTNTVASSGTALTLDQVKLVKRFTNNIYIAFDMDAAGQHAADRGIDLALSEGMNIKIIVVPKDFAKDPDECLKKDPAVWFKSVEEARSIMDYFFDKTFAGRDLKNPEKRGEAAKILLEQISRLGDTVEQDFWIKKLGQILDLDNHILYDRLSVLKKTTPLYNGAPRRMTGQNAPIEHKNKSEKATELLLAIILRWPELLTGLQKKIKSEILMPENLRDLYEKFVKFCYEEQSTEKDFKKVIHRFCKWNDTKEHCQIVDILELLMDKEMANYSQDAAGEEAGTLIKHLNLWYNSNVMRQLEREMKLAEEQGDKNKINELHKKIMGLSL